MSIDSLTDRSYVPYSEKPAACAIGSESGMLYPGVRIENISFPLTIPAVQSALFSCLVEADRPETLYIDSEKDVNTDFWKKAFGLRVAEPAEASSEHLHSPFLVGHADDEIPGLLKQWLERAVVPNSGFPVSAVLETEEGLVCGANVEPQGAAWEMGLCAERVALARAIAGGASGFRAMHIHTRRGEYSSPCGACRQVILEQMPRKPVFIHHPDGSISRHFSNDLLPYSFKSDYLKRLKHR